MSCSSQRQRSFPAYPSEVYFLNNIKSAEEPRLGAGPHLPRRATPVLNGTLDDDFHRRHLGFRPANDDRRPTAAAA